MIKYIESWVQAYPSCYLANQVQYVVSVFSILFILFVCLFTVLSPAQEFFTYMETSPLPVKGGKI
jgi:hypothetical protein